MLNFFKSPNREKKKEKVVTTQTPKIVVPTSVKMPNEDEKLWKIVMSMEKISNFSGVQKYIWAFSQHNRKTDKKIDLKILETVLEEEKDFYKSTLPFIVNLMKELPKLFPNGLKTMEIGKSATVTFTKRQVACILCNSFFCTFDRPSAELFWGLSLMPSINLDDMYCSLPNPGPKIAKLKMFMNYFRRISVGLEERKDSILTIRRIYKKKEGLNFVELLKGVVFVDPQIFEKNTIEDSDGDLQVDFANRFIGGASISYGCVQEEIRFSINPELNVARLICPAMNECEAIVITNSEQFSTYDGYAFSLKFGKDYVDKKKDVEILAIDATNYSYNKLFQYQKKQILRELWKAIVGFSETKLDAIATGNWGCGAFRGDIEVKFILQWIACSLYKKKMKYYTFNKKELTEKLNKFKNFILEKKIEPIKVLLLLIKYDNRGIFDHLFKIL